MVASRVSLLSPRSATMSLDCDKDRREHQAAMDRARATWEHERSTFEERSQALLRRGRSAQSCILMPRWQPSLLRLRTIRARVAQLKTANSDVEIMKRKVAKLTELVRTETDTGRMLRDFAPRD